jgi:hypothetical protein
VTSFVCVPPLMLITAAFIWRNSTRSFVDWIWSCLTLGAPVLLGVIAYGWYNFARFGELTEFGVKYQLTLQPFYGNPRYVLPNIFSYLFGSLEYSCQFPYARIVSYRHLSALIKWPPGYQSFEKVGGVMYTSGWLWFVVLAVWRLVTYLLTRRGRPSASNTAADLSPLEGWLLACAAATMLSVVPVLSLWEASMRYFEEALSGLLFIATFGVFWALRRTHLPGIGWAFTRALVALVGVQTCVMGATSAFSTYDDPFKRYNPALYQKLESALSLCSLGQQGQ